MDDSIARIFGYIAILGAVVFGGIMAYLFAGPAGKKPRVLIWIAGVLGILMITWVIMLGLYDDTGWGVVGLGIWFGIGAVIVGGVVFGLQLFQSGKNVYNAARQSDKGELKGMGKRLMILVGWAAAIAVVWVVWDALIDF